MMDVYLDKNAHYCDGCGTTDSKLYFRLGFDLNTVFCDKCVKQLAKVQGLKKINYKGEYNADHS